MRKPIRVPSGSLLSSIPTAQTCGLHVHELPEHQSLPVGIVAEVHTTAPGSSSIRQSLSPSLLTAGSLPAGSQAAYARLVERQDAAARALQAVYRAHLSHTLRRSCLRQHRAATTLSRVYRGHLGRRVSAPTYLVNTEITRYSLHDNTYFGSA